MNDKSLKEVVVGSPSAALPFSAVIGYGELLFVSGGVGRDPETKAMALGDVKAQTTQALANIQALLERAGSSMDRVLKTTVFLTDMRLFGQMNEAYRPFFSSDPPARSCVGATSLPDPEALVEIEIVAARS